CDREKRTVTITAPDDQTAQKALDALAEGGFHGKTADKKLAMKDASDVPSGKVKSLTLTRVHTCCGACCRAIKETGKKVDVVNGDAGKPKGDTFEVTGDFEAAALVKALNDAGFSVKIKK